ncbi:hypothetical protein HanXRQr2_Chr10g0424281 [Helianthus annuus]|uniref:Uncharacterized protein n=1 Tax=Helianthus annuus TaxID=4232 RepID=A0A9K3HV41_HELAN|nr:hypothetical protein HanXRQr2_Chr10g0424281 [Helianthus annuus]
MLHLSCIKQRSDFIDFISRAKNPALFAIDTAILIQKITKQKLSEFLKRLC